MDYAIWWIVAVVLPAIVLGIVTWAMRLLSEVHRFQQEQLQIQRRILAALERMADAPRAS